MTLNQIEYENKKSVLESYPSYVFLELTRNCNLYCGMCRQHVMYSNEWFMSDDILQKVEEQILSHAEIVDLRGWGESTLDARLIPLCERLHNKGIETMLYTNMCAQTTDFWKRLIKTGIRLAISIEAGEPVQYSRTRRGGSLGVVSNHIKCIMNEVEKNDNLHKPFFTTVLSEKNLDSLDKLIILAAKLGIEKIELNPISRWKGNGFIDEAVLGFSHSIDENIIKKFEYIFHTAKKNHVEVTIAANMFNENSVVPHICIHPWRYCVISYNGDISFCDHILLNENALMGNIQKDDFWHIWNNDKYVNLREAHAHQKYDCFDGKGIMCKWCSINRYGNNEYLIQPNIKAIPIDKYIENMYELNLNNNLEAK